MDVQKPLTDTELNLFDLMCVDAAHVLMQQCGREYEFATEDLCGQNAQATQIYLLSTEELVHLPSNNLPAEQHLAAFWQRAPVANFMNKKFKAKAICNDMAIPLVYTIFKTSKGQKISCCGEAAK